jgi:hypothetical protein
VRSTQVRGTDRRRLGLPGLLLLATGLAAGCAGSGPPGGDLARIRPPEGWQKADPAAFTVPGTPLAAWRGPAGSTLVLYRSLPSLSPSASSLAEEETNRLRNLPSIADEPPRTVSVGGRFAAHVEAVGPGTGDALAPSGAGTPVAPEGRPLVPTRRLALGRPTPEGTYWLLWHYPEGARGRIEPQIGATVASIDPSP